MDMEKMRQVIKNVVVVMLENRSFDNVLGYLYSKEDPPQHNIPRLKEGEAPFHGLSFVDTQKLANDGVPPQPGVRATNTPGWDPGEEYGHVNVQLFRTDPPPDPLPAATMKGFLKDYILLCNGDPEAQKQIMHMYTPADLPVINRLAKAYAVSDLWFSSVPSQTNANRAFSICGQSSGLVDNGFLTTNAIDHKLANDRFHVDTIWNVLDGNGFHDWKIFWWVEYPPLSHYPYTYNVFPHLKTIGNIESHFDRMENFLIAAEQGSLPRYSYIEPTWGGKEGPLFVMGDEYHPPSDVTPGEKLLMDIYDSLCFGDQWKQTLLVITFDEHGGTYDHVPPGAATPPGIPPEKGRSFGRPPARPTTTLR